MEASPTRRRYLAAVGVGVSGLAGCPSAPVEVSFPSLDAAAPSYRRWIPPRDGDVHWWIANNIQQVLARRDRLPRDRFVELTIPTGLYFGYGVGDTPGVLLGIAGDGWLVVIPGRFDLGLVDDVLRRSGWDPHGESGRMSLYRQSSSGAFPTPIAVADEGVIIGSGFDSGFTELARAVLETAAGERPRRHEVDEAFRRFSDRVGWPLSTSTLRGYGRSYVVERFPRDVAEGLLAGYADHVVDDAMVRRYWLWPQAPSGVSAADVRSALRTSVLEELRPERGRVAMRSAGRATEVAIVSPIRDPGGGPLPARFNLEADLDGRRLTVHHRAGDRIARSDLTVTGAGDDVGFGTGTLGPGDAVSTTLEDRPTGPVRVIYSVPESDMVFVAAAVDPASTN